MGGGDLGGAMVFGLVCFFFVIPIAFLGLQMVEGNLEFKSAALIYLPLLFCWIGIVKTFNQASTAPIAYGLGALAIGWCIFIPFQIIAREAKVHLELREERVQELRSWLEKHPDDVESHIKLAETYEELKRHRDAYQQYAIVIGLDNKQKHVHIRARELYKTITGKPAPEQLTLLDGEQIPPASIGHDPAPPRAPGEGRLHELHLAAQREPDVAARHADLGAELLRQGRTSDAADAYRRAMERDPGNDRYRSNFYALLEPDADPAALLGAEPATDIDRTTVVAAGEQQDAHQAGTEAERTESIPLPPRLDMPG